MGTKTHKVVAGETLSAIAAKYGTTVEKIAADNNIANVNQIMVGQELKISGAEEKPKSTGYDRKLSRGEM